MTYEKIINTVKALALGFSITATLINNPTTVQAASKVQSVRYSAGIVTGAKTITTQDGNIWKTKRKLHLRKGTNVNV
ncbi:MAG TPA: hypothetical protein DCW90_06065, partial [Lachnospiraceae bacterium]|nr:hypothetical protein [Lachnospiraceae bacterium]